MFFLCFLKSMNQSQYIISTLSKYLRNPHQLWSPFAHIIHCPQCNHHHNLYYRINYRFLVFFQHPQTHYFLFAKSLYKSCLYKCLHKRLTQNQSNYTNPYCINICLFSQLRFFFKYFRGAVRYCIRMIMSNRVVLTYYKSFSKIRKHQYKSFVYQHISRFYVQMNNLFVMKKN
jgi:hypothetical protein